MRRSLLFAVAILVSAFALGGSAGAQSAFVFQLGFKSLAGQIPGVAGDPVESEWHNPDNGDGLQRTTTGMMVWRKADNWTAFTNGASTWINGPYGVQARLNDQRFDWERDGQQVARATTSIAPPASASQGYDTAAEAAALAMINASRAQHGVGPVVMDGMISAVARAHSEDMARRGFFGHVNPDGQGPFDRMAAAGIRYGAAAENLGTGYGHGSAAETVRRNHEAMMAEVPPQDGHRTNILNPSLHRVGIGVFVSPEGKVYYTSDFTD